MRPVRWFVVVALLANIGYAAWQAGALRAAGLAPTTERDPGRLQQQVRPNALRVLSPQAAAAAVGASASAAAVGPLPGPTAAPVAAPASAAEGAASTPLACLEIGPLDNAAAIDNAERVLAAALPDRGERVWLREQRPAGAQYVVFVGPVLSRDAARQRREELVKLKMSFEPVELPGGQEGGYSLGKHDTEAAALSALDALRERGLRDARVALLRAEGSPRTWLRLDNLRGAAADTVRALPANKLGGQAAAACVMGSAMSATPR
jgi:SPOR domain